MQKFVVLVLFLSLLFIHGRSQYPFRSCSKTTLPRNSTYFSNLKSLSSKLIPSNSSHNLYNKASVGRPPNSPAYADFQCRGDLNATACRRCVAAATTNSSQQYCPLSVQAAVWFDECSYRYSNESFFSVLDNQDPLIFINGAKIEADVEGFDQVVASTVSDTVANASSAKGDLKFATKEGSFRGATVYTLAQCTADLSTANCGKCLSDAVRQFTGCCSGQKGARVLFSRCTFRYELYPFYDGVLHSTISFPPAESPADFIPPPAESPADSSPPPADSSPPPADSSPPPADSSPPPAAPSLPSSPSAPAPSTAAPPLLSGKGRATVALMFGILAAYFLS